MLVLVDELNVKIIMVVGPCLLGYMLATPSIYGKFNVQINLVDRFVFL